MNLELIGIIISSVAVIISVGVYFGRLNSRIDTIEDKIETILDIVSSDGKVLKMSDFRKNKH